MFLSGASFSGSERDHFFLNVGGREFLDLSGIAGLDSVADGRAGGLIDMDRDGWVDLVVVNSNTPQLRLFRNRIGERSPNRSVTIRLYGGNTGSSESELSNRDGIGAIVTVLAGDAALRRELRAGEGFAAQNSNYLQFGIGASSSASGVRVRWPSGRSQEFGALEAGTLLEIFEEPAMSADGSGFTLTPWSETVSPRTSLSEDTAETVGTAKLDGDYLELPSADRHGLLTLYVSLATWCENCAKEVQELRHIMDTFDAGQLTVVGVPVDETDTPEMLTSWRERLRVPYALLNDITSSQVRGFQQLIEEELRQPGLPASVLTDKAGRVLHVQWGAPDMSTIRRLLRTQQSQEGPRR